MQLVAEEDGGGMKATAEPGFGRFNWLGPPRNDGRFGLGWFGHLADDFDAGGDDLDGAAGVPVAVETLVFLLVGGGDVDWCGGRLG